MGDGVRGCTRSRKKRIVEILDSAATRSSFLIFTKAVSVLG